MSDEHDAIRRALVAVFVARTAINGALRIVYPFLPAIARGLDVSLGAVGAAVAVRNLGGVVAPLAARASERRGRRSLMLWMTIVTGLGCLLTAATAWFWLAAVGMVVVGLAAPAFAIAMQSWFGDRVPYSDRGRVFGITELTWAIALVVTVPVSGFLIGIYGWRAPFVLIAVLSFVGAAAIARGISSDRPASHVRRPLKMTSDRFAVLGVAFLVSMSAEVLFVVYGQWLEDSFGLSVAGIGLFTLVIVAAELVGEVVVTAASDSFGLRRMTMAGLLVSAAAYLSFATVGTSLVLAIAVVMVWVASFEVTIVAAIPLASEFAPESRDRLLSLFSSAVAGGRAFGALVAPAIFAAGGITASGMMAAAGALLAAVVLIKTREQQSTAK